MKKFALLIAVLSMATALSAQVGSWRTINASSCVVSTQISFTNGRQLSDHLFVGFGFGVDKTAVINITIQNATTGLREKVSLGGYSIPVFADGKWRLFDSWLSPSLRLRAGALFNVHMSGIGIFATPEIGLDISRYFTLSVGWNGHWLYTPDYSWYNMTAYPLWGLSVRF